MPHSLKGRLVAIATEARSSRSVMIWNSNSAPRGSMWTYPSSSTYTDIGIARSMPTPRLCRACGSVSPETLGAGAISMGVWFSESAY